MKKNFTQLISSFTYSKKYVIALTSLMIFLAGSLYLYANILAITPQNVSVSADTAVGGPSAAFTVLNPIVIQEGDQKDFNNGNGNLILNAPIGWVFRQSGVIPNVTHTGGGSAPNVSTGTVAYTSSTITIPITVSGENRVDRLEISGVALQATTGTILPARAVTLSLSGITVAGLASPTTVANISQIPGNASKLAFGQQPTATDIYTAITPAPTVLIQDWAGNTVTNTNSSVSVAIGNNPSVGVLAGTTTVSAVNGVATFSGLSIDASGTGYTLSASSGSLTSAKSDPFTVNSTPPTLDVITACITIGDPAQEITLTGTNFARNAVARFNGSNRTTTYVSSTQLKMSLTAADLATAGNRTITVNNPNP